MGESIEHAYDEALYRYRMISKDLEQAIVILYNRTEGFSFTILCVNYWQKGYYL